MLKRLPIKATIGVILTIAALVFLLWGLSDFELSSDTISTHRFEAVGAIVEGSLVLPPDCHNPSVAVLVHGDGPQDRWSNEGYLPLVSALVGECIGVFSWDKPGVGKSTGNWLNQSMMDRAKVANAAILYLRSLPYISADRVGYLGFSQAGWVVPKAATLSRPSFTVLIGPAVNWRAQGIYFTERKLQREGYDLNEIAKITAAELAANDVIFGVTNELVHDPPQGMDSDRFGFVRMNYSSDARADLVKMQGPVLAIWGASDLNVNPIKNYELYRDLLDTDEYHRVIIQSGGTHSLLRASWFNYQTSVGWPIWKKALFASLGRRAYAPESIEVITEWINSMVLK